MRTLATAFCTAFATVLLLIGAAAAAAAAPTSTATTAADHTPLNTVWG